MAQIAPFLRFEKEAEEAVKLCVSLIPNFPHGGGHHHAGRWADCPEAAG